jgi:hypothetical protein
VIGIMRIMAMTLAIVATAAGAAVAQPAPEQMPKDGSEATARVRYGDDRAKPPGDQVTTATSGDGWVELASATPASHGREFISVDGGAGPMTMLRLTAASGRPYISAVRIELKDGTRKAFVVDKPVGKRPVQIDLKGARDIAQLVVVSDRTSTGAYVVEAKARPDGVASR